jgi:hypothetical protein
MPAVVRHAIVLLVLVVATIWPAVHVFVTDRLELDPWRFGGWAMYTTVRPQVIAEVRVAQGDRFVPLPDGDLEMKMMLRRASARTAILGRLASPRPLADLVFARTPYLAVELLLRRIAVDRHSGAFSCRRRTYRCLRGDRQCVAGDEERCRGEPDEGG